MSNFTSRDLNKFVVRMPDGMRDIIAKMAQKAARSMNAEIVHRLQESFRKENTLSIIEAINALPDQIKKALKK